MERNEFHIAIVGAGTMGSGLAQLFAQSGFPVTVLEQSEERLDQGLKRIRSSLDEGVKRKIFNDQTAGSIMQRISGATQSQEIAAVQLVIEAIYEDLGAKQKLFDELQSVCADHTIFATNTSSYRVEDIAISSAVARRLIGLHYFYPPAKNRLLEIVYHEQNTAEERYIIDALAAATGRITLYCKDECGFVVNRFFVPWLNEAARMLDEGVGDIAQINALSKREFDTGLGAFEIMNLTGIAPVAHTMETFHKRFGERYKPAKSLIKQNDSGQPWEIKHSQKREGTLKIVSPAFADMRFRGIVFMTTNDMLQEGVCTPADIEIGARTGLKWSVGPISRWNDLGDETITKTLTEFYDHHKFDQNKSSISLSSMGSERSFVRSDYFSGATIITMDRPDASNALSPELFKQLRTALEQAWNHDKTKVVVLRGVGKCFSAGGDLNFLRSSMRDSNFEAINDYFAFAQDLYADIDASEKPMVAFIEGVAAGGGAQLALACDLIVASPAASFHFPETSIGLFPGLGGTQRLPKRVSKELAKYLIFTGDTLDAKSALSIGLVDGIIAQIDWLSKVQTALKHIETVRADRAERTMPAQMTKIATLMNSKNVSRLLNRKSAATLPDDMFDIYEKTQGKHLYAMKIANDLIDKSVGLNLASGLKQELSALQSICRNKETVNRILESK